MVVASKLRNLDVGGKQGRKSSLMAVTLQSARLKGKKQKGDRQKGAQEERGKGKTRSPGATSQRKRLWRETGGRRKASLK